MEMLTYSDNALLDHIEDHMDMFKVNDISTFIQTTTPFKGLFKTHINDAMIERYKGDFTNLRKELLFFNMMLMQIRYPDLTFTHDIIEQIFGLNKNDTSKLCERYNLKVSPAHRKLTSIEARDLGLPSASLVFENEFDAYLVPIGYNIKGKDIDESIKNLQDRIGQIQVNMTVLEQIKDKIENRDYYNKLLDRDEIKETNDKQIDYENKLREDRYNIRFNKDKEIDTEQTEKMNQYTKFDSHASLDEYAEDMNSAKSSNRMYLKHYTSNDKLQRIHNFLLSYNIRMFKRLKLIREQYNIMARISKFMMETVKPFEFFLNIKPVKLHI
ncbi:hypothetical protein [uncultured Arcobacter sp.]|uniref:hypothetical protein n=1 Tax=uncultured Arcobacter sp. TaxID=165434 RepID=UPI0026269CC7|nr:hypothetical protein [uncultured Arcobacter sp.]